MKKPYNRPAGVRNAFPPCPLRGTSPASGGRITRAYCSATYERIALRSFIVPPLRGGEGGAVRHQRGESHQRWLITVMLFMTYDAER